MVLEDSKTERKALLLLILIGVIYFLYLVRIVLLPFILAILIVYLVEPVINWLVNKGVERHLALALIFFILVGGTFIIGLFAIPILIEELNILAQRLPKYGAQIQQIIDVANRRYARIDLPPTFQIIVENVINRVEQITLRFVERTTQVIIGFVSRFFSLIMAPILAFYMLKDIKMIKKNFWSLIPKDSRKEAKTLVKKIDEVLLGYMKGQLLVALLVGVLSMLGLYLLQVKFYLIIGLFAGIMNLIPYLGAIFGALPAIFIVSLKSINDVLAVILLFTVIQQLEGSLISPKIVGSKVGLHPIVIIFSLLVGGEILGIFGMLLAVPIAGVIKVVIDYFLGRMIQADS